MKRTWKTVILIAIGVVMVSCTQPGPEGPQPDAAVETGPDPAAVDAQHYKIEFENDRVRVVRISYGPGEESVMHYHPDSVAVFLTDQDVTFGMADGTSEESHVAAGQHRFAAAGQHLPKNIGDAPLKLVLVELKSGGAQTDAGAAGETGPDPTEVDADHYTAEFENERVRVLRVTYGAGEQSTMHYHPDSVAVSLTGHHVSMGLPDGSSEEVRTTPGEHRFVSGGQHLPKNLAEQPFEVILVELKGS